MLAGVEPAVAAARQTLDLRSTAAAAASRAARLARRSPLSWQTLAAYSYIIVNRCVKVSQQPRARGGHAGHRAAGASSASGAVTHAVVDVKPELRAATTPPLLHRLPLIETGLSAPSHHRNRIRGHCNRGERLNLLRTQRNSNCDHGALDTATAVSSAAVPAAAAARGP